MAVCPFGHDRAVAAGVGEIVSEPLTEPFLPAVNSPLTETRESIVVFFWSLGTLLPPLTHEYVALMSALATMVSVAPEGRPASLNETTSEVPESEALRGVADEMRISGCRHCGAGAGQLQSGSGDERDERGADLHDLFFRVGGDGEAQPRNRVVSHGPVPNRIECGTGIRVGHARFRR